MSAPSWSRSALTVFKAFHPASIHIRWRLAAFTVNDQGVGIRA